MELSKRRKALLIAYEKGYRIIDGEIYYRGKKVKGYLSKKNEYKTFGVRMLDGKLGRVSVHRLVAYQKYGDKIFEPGIEVRHFDSISTNNLEDNILIGTHSQNMMDQSTEVRLTKSLAAADACRKYSHSKIMTMHKNGLSYLQIMKETGIKSKGTISFIIKQSIEAKLQTANLG